MTVLPLSEKDKGTLCHSIYRFLRYSSPKRNVQFTCCDEDDDDADGGTDAPKMRPCKRYPRCESLIFRLCRPDSLTSALLSNLFVSADVPIKQRLLFRLNVGEVLSSLLRCLCANSTIGDT